MSDKRAVRVKIVKQEIDYDKLADAIVKANNKIEEDKLLAEKSKKEEVIKKRREILKENEFSHIKYKIWKLIRRRLNSVIVFINILFMKRRNVKYFSAVDALSKTAIIAFLFIVRMAMYAFALVNLFVAFKGENVPLYLFLSVIVFIFAQLFRLVEIEVEYMKDGERVMAVFAGIVSIASLLISIATIYADNGTTEMIELLKTIRDLI